MQNSCKRSIAGFTLLEIIATMTVAAILLGVALPSFRSLISGNRNYVIANEFVELINLARSEAVKRATTVAICAASDDTYTDCVSAGGFSNNDSWRQGWIVFVDTDADGEVDAATDIIRVKSALPNNVTLTAASRQVSYGSNGFVVTGGNQNYVVTTIGCSGDSAGSVNISIAGRPSYSRSSC